MLYNSTRMVFLVIGDWGELFMGYVVIQYHRSVEFCHGSSVPGRPSETPFYGQFRSINDRIKLTEGTFCDVHRNPAVTPQSLGALRRNGKMESFREELGKGSAFFIFKAFTPQSGGSPSIQRVKNCVILLPETRNDGLVVAFSAETVGKGFGQTGIIQSP